jgi:hypothetical protein
MRGSVSDALIGRVQKSQSMDAPFDRFVADINFINPMQAIPQDVNNKYLLYSRQYLPDDMIVTSAQTTAISLDPSVPNTLNENGSTPIPRAGIFKYIMPKSY